MLRTLGNAGHYAAALPKAEHHRAEVEMLIMAAEGCWPLMFEDIAMRRALHIGKGRDVAKAAAQA